MDGLEEAFARGMAVGVAKITTDTVYFRFRNEEFEFPAYELLGKHHIIRFNGNYYEAKVEKLRRLARRKNNG